jgi:hypothetical protein
VLSLTARGLTTGEISSHFAEVYGASVSKDTISKITDKVVEERTEWANRPLDPGQFLVNVANHRWLLVACPSLHGLVRCLVGEAQPRPVVELCSDQVELVGGPTSAHRRSPASILRETVLRNRGPPCGAVNTSAPLSGPTWSRILIQAAWVVRARW